MKRICAALRPLWRSAAGLVAPAHAVPPTATPSPGYDARLQEQRAAAVYTPRTASAEARRAGASDRLCFTLQPPR